MVSNTEMKEIKTTTSVQYDECITPCRDIFLKKNRDYGSAWRILRLSSLVDQIYIKAKRLKSIEEKGEQKVEDDIKLEYVGMINYCVMALIQMEIGPAEEYQMDESILVQKYDKEIQVTKDLMLAKNHDYGEAWREMKVSTFTDLILMKLLRIRQIEENKGKTIISEGIDANFRDIINYSVFALIRLN